MGPGGAELCELGHLFQHHAEGNWKRPKEYKNRWMVIWIIMSISSRIFSGIFCSFWKWYKRIWWWSIKVFIMEKCSMQKIYIAWRQQLIDVHVKCKHACVKDWKKIHKYDHNCGRLWRAFFPPPVISLSVMWLKVTLQFKHWKEILRRPSQKACRSAHSAHKPACIVLNHQLDPWLSVSDCSPLAEPPASTRSLSCTSSCPGKHWVLLLPTSVSVC